MTINALPYAASGWESLNVLAVSHEDGYVRIAAAESLIRLAEEFAPPHAAVYELPEDERP